MKLRAIDISGFKSFRDTVRLEISDGMTCIVGPNGCGKSNVVDAIKWTMGDMSPKSLRGDSMQDVIFAGTEKRKPAGMAEVTLTFENRTPQLPGLDESAEESVSEDPTGESEKSISFGDSIPREFRNLSEIAITRRLHRSGESEYLINKVPCRLRDIQNLLAGTGLGKQGYSIIEQGEIGFIVNARPDERRLIIEEASGITRYKDQRQRSERKLEKTELNLQRTRDILEEIEKQLHTLEGQAKKAREHQEISEELRGLEIALLLRKRHEGANAAADLKTKHEAAQKAEQEARTKEEAAEESLKAARVEAHQIEKGHTELTESFYRVETRLNLSESNREHAKEAAEGAALRQKEIIEELQQQEKRQEYLRSELLRLEEELEGLEEGPRDGGEGLREIEIALLAKKEEREKLRESWEATRRDFEACRREEERLRDRIQWLEREAGEGQERREAAAQAIEAVKEEELDLDRRIARLTMDFERASEEIERLQRKQTEQKQDEQKLKEFVEERRGLENSLARKVLGLRTRIESLEEIRSRGEGYADGVRLVLDWAREENRDDVFGPVGDALQVPVGEEAAVAAFLGERLGDILVRSRDTAFEALEMLSRADAGRVGCVVVEEGCDVQVILQGWLKGLEIVKDLRDVDPLSAPESVEAWATPGGDILFRSGRVVGGGVGDQTETMLRQVRELDSLRKELAGREIEHQEISSELELGEEDLVFLQDELALTGESLQDATHRARGFRLEKDGELREQSRARERFRSLEEELTKLDGRKTSIESEKVEAREGLEKVTARLPTLKDDLKSLEFDLESQDEELERLATELTEQKVEVAQIHERRRHVVANVERVKKGLEDAGARILRYAQEQKDQEDKEEEAKAKVHLLGEEVERLKKDHSQITAALKEARESLQAVEVKVQSLELKVLARRQDREEARDAVQKVEIARREAQWSIEQVDKQLEESFGLELEEAQQIALSVKVPSMERKSRAEFLKQRLKRIGTVNPLAIEEFEETKERHTFHHSQQTDLEESVRDLRLAIQRMDMESRKRFGETFEEVNEKFKQVFPKLFRGGKARLILTNPDNLLASGVDIEVQPPGKKLQNVTLLSGGEKALTAVSLIFSIFLLKPTPFAVLDEVDAPLDDANVGRFAQMVRDLSDTSQMIVITHNRRTMEAPQKLYGVTMEEAGISKVVSVRLSDDDDRLAG